MKFSLPITRSAGYLPAENQSGKGTRDCVRGVCWQSEVLRVSGTKREEREECWECSPIRRSRATARKPRKSSPVEESESASARPVAGWPRARYGRPGTCSALRRESSRRSALQPARSAQIPPPSAVRPAAGEAIASTSQKPTPERYLKPGIYPPAIDLFCRFTIRKYEKKANPYTNGPIRPAARRPPAPPSRKARDSRRIPGTIATTAPPRSRSQTASAYPSRFPWRAPRAAAPGTRRGQSS